MAHRSRVGAAFSLALIMAASHRAARADDSAAAQALFDQAKTAMAAHDYRDACPKLEESLRLQEAVGTLLNLADCYEREGRLASAWSRFLEVTAKARAAGQSERARIARERADALAPKLPNLEIDVSAASRVDGLEIRRDGTVVGPAEWGVALPADAGEHTVEASAPARTRWVRALTVPDAPGVTRVTIPGLESPSVEPHAKSRGEPESGELSARAPSAASAPLPKTAAQAGGDRWRIGAISFGSAGVIGIGVGSIFGVIASSKHDEAKTACPSDPCKTRQGQGLWRDAVDLGNVSTIAFVAGGIALGGGVVLWFAAPHPAEPSALVARIALGPGTIALDGTW